MTGRHRILSAVIGFMLLIASGAVSAQLYKWVDANGVTHFSDKPAGQQGISIAPTSAPSAGSPGNKGDAAGAPSSSDYKSKELDFQRRQIKRKEAEASAAQAEEENAELRREKCLRGRKGMDDMTAGVPVYTFDAQGNRVFLNDDQRANALREARQAVNENC